MTTSSTLPRNRRSKSSNDQRTVIVTTSDRGLMPSGSWSAPLWGHALPAWRGNGQAHDLTVEAELAYKQDAVRRWRGLPGSD